MLKDWNGLGEVTEVTACWGAGIGRNSHTLDLQELGGFHVFRHHFLWTCSNQHLYTILLDSSGRIGVGDGDEMELDLDGQMWWCSELPCL
jgi:hypothetical protein